MHEENEDIFHLSRILDPLQLQLVKLMWAIHYIFHPYTLDKYPQHHKLLFQYKHWLIWPLNWKVKSTWKLNFQSSQQKKYFLQFMKNGHYNRYTVGKNNVWISISALLYNNIIIIINTKLIIIAHTIWWILTIINYKLNIMFQV